MTGGAAPATRCSSCGAAAAGAASYCWICGAELVAGGPRAAPPPGRETERPLGGTGRGLVTVFVLLLLGVSLIATGLIVPLVLVAGPAFYGVWRAARSEEDAGRPVERRRQIGAFVASLLLCLCLLFVAGVAALGLVCGAVLVDETTRGQPATERVTIVAFVIAGVVLAVGSFVFFGRSARRVASRMLSPLPPSKPPRPRRAWPSDLRTSTLMLAIALLTVAIGVGIEAPGLGILMGVVTVPPVIIVGVKRTRREREGSQVSRGRLVVEFTVAAFWSILFASLALMIGVFCVCLAYSAR